MFETFQNLFAPPRHMILLVIAAWFGLTFAESRTERHGIGREDLNNITFFGLIAFVIGGRISYVLQNLSAFTKSPVGVISINPDLFDPIGAAAAALIVAIAYGQRKNLAFWNILDALTPFFAVIAIGLGLSHLAAGSAFGSPTDLPWGIDLWNATRHPTQIYETLASFLIVILLWRSKPHPRPGISFLFFASLTALTELILLAFRAEYTSLTNGFRQEQVIAWVTLLACFILLEVRLKPVKKQTL
ncbi:MAG: prolipoprotein diacylglyceryl transferase [Anaerolineales bacterium]|uniref:prolipoprotein diacylglyceryl transferase n=1 Tax=Candidatus Villigracilis vicinus TaxID=3140679 RepID=UPI0031361CFF|nr:prolipoprotein diacylglyceryl transferase [Anaerolineales bacterium]MBK9782609.1 prolipoprotein diacylglyceryl transferase [Anaerolineales bacterium]